MEVRGPSMPFVLTLDRMIFMFPVIYMQGKLANAKMVPVTIQTSQEISNMSTSLC